MLTTYYSIQVMDIQTARWESPDSRSLPRPTGRSKQDISTVDQSGR